MAVENFAAAAEQLLIQVAEQLVLSFGPSSLVVVLLKLEDKRQSRLSTSAEKNELVHLPNVSEDPESFLNSV